MDAQANEESSKRAKRSLNSGQQTNTEVRIFANLLPLITKYPGMLIGFIFFLLLASTLTLLLPFLFRVLVDCGFANTASEACTVFPFKNSSVTLIVWGILLSVLLGIATAARYYLVSRLGERVVADLRQTLFQQLLYCDMTFYARHKTGDMIARLTSDTAVVQSVIGSSISVVLRTSVTAIGAMVLMVFVSWQLTGLVLLLILCVLIPMAVMSRRMQKLSRLSQDELGRASARASERLYGLRTIQLFNREPAEVSAFSAAVDATYDSAMRRNGFRAIMTALAFSFMLTGLVLILSYGLLAVSRGDLSPGEMAQFLLYAFVVATGAAVLSENYSELKRASGAFERIMELFNVGHLTEENTIDNLQSGQSVSTIEFQAASFSYPEKGDNPAVNQLSLRVEPGETVAIVGPSGSGKSTLFQLLTRMYPLSEGKITINGIDIEQLSRSAVRDTVAVVEQSPTLFSDTVAENIAVGNANAAQEAIVQAAKRANAHDFITELPQGYNTVLGEHGLTLSGGQRQRVAIARAMLKNAPILLLDEATSALDAESEHLLRNIFSGKTAELTTIVIAHRLSTIRHADKIVFMENGELVEQGTHEQLVALDGRYARYLKLQNSGIIQKGYSELPEKSH